MHIVSSDNDFWNSLNKNDSLIPLILVDGMSCLYYLVKDVQKGLESFILTGKTDATEFHVFEEEQERAMISHWTGQKLSVTYHSQQIEYMHHDRITIIYMQVSDPDTGMSICLIPWFMLPGRPYPVFVYIYAICHYDRAEKKSLSQSAAAAGRVFGIGRLNKSTVSRNIKALKNFIDVTRNGVEEREAPVGAGSAADTGGRATGADGAAVTEMIGRIPEIIKNCPSAEALEEEYGEMVKPIPRPVNRTETARRAPVGIPEELFNVINESALFGNKHRDDRKRPARPRPGDTDEAPKRVQRIINFVDSWEIDRIRKEFIEICRQLALDAAISYHRFLV